MRLFDWLRGIHRRVRSGRYRRKNRPRIPQSMELLETRALLSAVSFTGDLQTPGVLLIELNSTSTTTLTVGSQSVSSADGSAFDALRVTINSSAAVVRRDGAQAVLINLPTALVSRIVITGDQNRNVVDLTGVSSEFGLIQAAAIEDQRPVPATLSEAKSLSVPSFFGVIVSTWDGDDLVIGSSFNEWVDAGTGDDGVTVGDGDDNVIGGVGEDTVFGGAGNDVLDGGDHHDLILGGLGDDTILGDAGNDVLVGGYGRDWIDGGSGNDLLIGATLAFESGLNSGLNNVRDRWLASAANDEVRRQSIAPARTVVLNELTATTTKLIVPTSTAKAFDPATYGTQLPSGTKLSARIDDEVVRVVSVIATSDPDTETLVVERQPGNAQVHAANSTLIVQSGSQSPLRGSALWTSPVNADIGQTVYEDFVTNTMTGGSGKDWFFVSDELLTFTDTTGDPQLGGDDVLIDLTAEDARYKAVQLVPDGRRQAVPEESSAALARGESVTAVRGTITRLGGDPGTEVLTANRLGDPATDPHVWGGLVRTPYVTTPSFNVTSDLVHLVNFSSTLGGPNESGQTNWNLLLKTEELADPSQEAVPMTPTIPSRNWRWSLNPAEPNIEYGFVSGVGPNGEFSGVQKYRYLTTDDDVALSGGIQQVYQHPSQTLIFQSFDPLRVGGLIFTSKTSLYFNPENGHNYTLLIGNPRDASQPGGYDRSILNAYVVDLDVAPSPNASQWSDPVVASFRLDAPAGTVGFPFGSTPQEVDDFYFAPDGRSILVAYQDEVGAAFRLLDVDLQSGTIVPHVMPVMPKPDADIAILRSDAVRLNGFFPFIWHHPVFAQGASGTVYVVGQPGTWSKDNLISPNLEYLAGVNTIGQVMRFDPQTNMFASLTDPALENFLPGRETVVNLTATNTQNPGYVFASYASNTDSISASSPAYQGALVAINLEQPTGQNGAVILAKHRTQYGDSYIAQPIINASSDGTRLLFHSTWGEYQQVISTYSVQPGARVELFASGNVVLRCTGPNSVALFASVNSTTPISGTQTTISAFDTLIIKPNAGQSLNLSVDFSAGTPVPTGGVLEVDGTVSNADGLALLNAANSGTWTWSVTGNGAGQVRGTSTGLIRFTGVESLTGSDGSDHFYISPAARWQGTLSGGGGTDRLNFGAFTTGVSASLRDGSVSFAGTSFVGQISQFEDLSGGAGDDELIGNDASNIFDGGSGNDTILGEAGDDLISVGLGDDSIDGGAGTDLLVGQGDFDFRLTDAALVSAFGNSALKNIDLVRLTGGVSDNVLDANGFSGSVTLVGGDGNDTLADAAGNDRLIGGNGDDVYRMVGSGTDTLSEAAGEGSDRLDYSPADGGVNIDLSRSTLQTLRLNHRLVLGASIEAFSGSRFDDVITLLTADAGLTRQLDGGVNDDPNVLDTLRILSGAMTWSISSSTGGRISGSSSVPPIAFTGVESLAGGSGDDAFVLASGVTFDGAIDGGGGNDSLDWSRLATGRLVTLTGSGSTGFDGQETSLSKGFRGIDSLTGGSRLDTLIGIDAATNWNVGANQLLDVGTSRPLKWSSFDVLIGGAGKDSFANVQTTLPMTLDGGAGDDSIDASAATAAVTLVGGDGNDTLIGGSSSDRLDGGAGDDLLMGGRGNDTLLGDLGDDSFDDTVGVNVFDGGDGSDSIRVIGTWTLGSSGSNTMLKSVEKVQGAGSSDVLVGTSGADLFTVTASDVTVSGFTQQTFHGFETLQGGMGLDTVTSGEGDDQFGVSSNGAVTLLGTTLQQFKVFAGGSGFDRLQGDHATNEIFTVGVDGVTVGGVLGIFTGFEDVSGGNGNDSLSVPSLVGDSTAWTVSRTNGGEVAGLTFSSIETLRGGSGDDTFTMLPGGSVVRIESGVGRDWLDYSAYDTSVSVDLNSQSGTGVSSMIGIMALRGGRGADQLIGSRGNEWLIGGDGDDTLDGGDGSDTLTGGLGRDLLSGGKLLDCVEETRDADMTLSNSTLFFNGVAEDTLVNIERVCLTGGSSANVIDASAFTGAVMLIGDAGNDTLTGGSGADSLNGGAGDDCLTGNGGIDSLIGSDGNDVLDDDPTTSILNGGAGLDTLAIRGSYLLAAKTMKALVGIETLQGSSANDLLTGTSSADVFVLVSPGIVMLNDLTLIGFETIDGSGGADRVQGSDLRAEAFEMTTTGITVIGWPGTTFVKVETVSGGGGAFLDSLIGTSGNDTVLVDTARGKITVNRVIVTDVEQILGGDGNDKLQGGSAADVFQLASSGVTLAKLNNVTFNDFENLFGGSGNDQFEVGDGAVFTGVLDGGVGTDVVTFASSSENREVTLTKSSKAGFAGRERWLGGSFLAVESVIGGSGSDTLIGLNVNATWDLASKQYKDRSTRTAYIFKWNEFENLIGGSGSDTFSGKIGSASLSLNGGAGNDLLEATTATLAVTLIGGDGDDTLKGGRGDDLLLGGAGEDSLVGGLGDDRLAGGSGNDVLDGGDGDDVLLSQLGKDVLKSSKGNDQIIGGVGDELLFG